MFLHVKSRQRIPCQAHWQRRITLPERHASNKSLAFVGLAPSAALPCLRRPCLPCRPCLRPCLPANRPGRSLQGRRAADVDRICDLWPGYIPLSAAQPAVSMTDLSPPHVQEGNRHHPCAQDATGISVRKHVRQHRCSLPWRLRSRTSHAAAAHAAKLHALTATAAGAATTAAEGVRLAEEGVEDVPRVALCPRKGMA